MDSRLIADNKLFAGLGRGTVARAARAAEPCAFAAGDLVWSEGDPSRGVLLVLDGELALAQRAASGEPVEVARCGPGTFLGATSALLGTRVHTATVTAATAARAALVPPDRFTALAAAEPRLSLNAFAHVAEHLARANTRLREAAERDRGELERRVSERTAALEGMSARVRRELAIAQRIQRNLLPERRHEFPGCGPAPSTCRATSWGATSWAPSR